MSSTCQFYRRKYTRSGAYENHLRTAHAGLDIVLTSTVQYINMESSVSHNPAMRERQHSDRKSDPAEPGSEPHEICRDIAYESDTEVCEDPTSPSTGKQIHYEGVRQVIGDVDGFEHEYSNLCDAHRHY